MGTKGSPNKGLVGQGLVLFYVLGKGLIRIRVRITVGIRITIRVYVNVVVIVCATGQVCLHILF